MTASWLSGFSFAGTKEPVKTSSLLPPGLYKAVVKNAYRSTIGTKNTPATTVVFELEDSGKEIVHNYFDPSETDTSDFKIKGLRNFLTRMIYHQENSQDYKLKDNDSINADLEKVAGLSQAQLAKWLEKLAGRKVLVNLTQEPFISKKDGAIEFLDIPKNSLIDSIPANILRVIAQHEEYTGTTLEKMPKIAFTNKINPFGNGVQFYADYEEKELKNSASYDWVQSLKKQAVAASADFSDDLIGEEEIPF